MQTQTLLGVLRQHKGADAVTRLHQPRRLQLGDRLAHHCAAHAMLQHDAGLGRQFFTGFELAQQDALGQRLDHTLGEVIGTFTHRVCAFNGHHYGSTGLAEGSLTPCPE